ncbi:MAG: 2-C-methyl-D-erythritol 4-phosphate cytidylyltransferase, partial [Deltaproteobacteria bacterium]|nr:2-C-methyl-D-erythritol 4-phosphate cytidylyltransferase [Deltaproteobacteria bacterium]
MRVVALIPAAGRGRRMGKETPKASLSLGGIPLLWHTLQK